VVSDEFSTTPSDLECEKFEQLSGKISSAGIYSTKSFGTENTRHPPLKLNGNSALRHAKDMA
jgi:hypothetical protein